MRRDRTPTLLAAAAASLKFLLLAPLLLALARCALAWRQAAPAPCLR